MDSGITIRLKAKYTSTFPTIKVICGTANAQVTVQNHPLLTNTSELHLMDNETNRKCVELARRGELQVSFGDHESIMSKFASMFEVDVSIDMVHLATTIVLSSQQKSLHILDSFDLDYVFKVFKVAYDHFSNRMANKVNRKLKRYIKISKRKESDLKILNKLYDAEIETEADVKKEEQNVMKEPENTGRTGDSYRKNRDKNKNYNNDWKKEKFSNQKNQRKNNQSRQTFIDPRILLGINGDTEDGWRARLRPPHVPQKNKSPEKKQQASGFKPANAPKKEELVKKQQIKPQATVIKKQVSLTGAVKSMFSFPRDGTKFDFSKLKQFMLFINGSFWVKYIGGSLTISKGEDAYIRKSELTMLQNGFMGEGLTLDLEGMANLEDGGQTTGDPKVSTFTGNDSQFFHIVTMEVYCMKAA